MTILIPQDDRLSVFHSAMQLATTGEFRTIEAVGAEIVRQKLGTAEEVADLPRHQRTYVQELCHKNFGRR